MKVSPNSGEETSRYRVVEYPAPEDKSPIAVGSKSNLNAIKSIAVV